MDKLSIKLIRIFCALLGATNVNGTQTNFVLSSTAYASTEPSAISHDSSGSNDGILTTEYYKMQQYAGDLLQYDLGLSREIHSVFMAQKYFNSGCVSLSGACIESGYDWPSNVKIYIGNTSYEGAYATDNTLCYSGGREGITACIGEGRYLIVYLDVSYRAGFRFAEIFAWADPSLGHYHVDSASLSYQDMTLASGGISELLETSDASTSTCV